MENNKMEIYQRDLKKVDQEFDELTQKLIKDLEMSNIETIDLNHYSSLKSTLVMKKNKIQSLIALEYR